jgi:PAS domain S-box-containing protein
MAKDFQGSLFRSIVENMHGSLAIVDAGLRILYANPQLGRLFRVPSARLGGWEVAKALRRVLDGRSCAFLLERARQRLAGLPVPASYTLKTVYRRREVRWFKLRVVLLPASGSGPRILAQFVDITEKKRALGALRKSERRYRTLVEAAPVGIVSVGRRGRILEANPKLREILGLPAASAAGELQPGALGFAGELEECFRSGKNRTCEIPFPGPRGEQGRLRVQLAPLRVRNGQVARVQAIVEDISEQKALEEAAAQARKLEALATLTGGIAHEFNNLLQVIQGYAEMYRLQRQDFEGLREICQATQRAAELTSQLLTFGGLQEGERRPLELNAEIRATVRLLQQSLLKRIQVELCLSEGLLPVAGDAAQLRQLLTNIAGNAAEALDRRGRIRFQTLNRSLGGAADPALPRPGPWVLLRISDNGPGIAPADLPNVFDPFFTARSSGKGAGTGLGLSVAYGIVRQHGGHIECRSLPGQGSSFDIYLPAGGPAPDPPDPPDPPG